MIKFQLDAKALMAFIESQGEEFKIKLSKAVFHTAVKNTVQSFVPDNVQDMIQEEVSHIGNKIAKESYLESSYMKTWSLKKSVQKKIYESMKAEVGNVLNKQLGAAQKEMINDKFDAFLIKMKRVVDKAIELRTHKIEQLINDKFNPALSEYIDNAVDEKFRLLNGNKYDT